MTAGSTTWVEKYRPDTWSGIILSERNIQILDHAFARNQFPNYVFAGPPGTGKTSTMLLFLKRYYIEHCGVPHIPQQNVIHLNGADERGVDVMRDSITNFVRSTPLFNSFLRFVILDEADCMSKDAQTALRYIVQKSAAHSKVRFILITNYRSKLDTRLMSENFVFMSFQSLPSAQVAIHLKDICAREGLDISDTDLAKIIQKNGADMRSMINRLQQLKGADSALFAEAPSAREQFIERVTSSLEAEKNNEQLVASVKHLVDIYFPYILGSPDIGVNHPFWESTFP